MNEMCFSPFPNLKTDRLNLRQLSKDDDKEIFTLRSDKRVLKFLDIPAAKTIDDARQYIEKINTGISENEWIMWGISLKNETKLMGTICFWKFSEDRKTAEIGVVLLPGYQKKGIAQEAFTKVIDFGFSNLGLKTVEGELSPQNLNCIKLLERNGFSKDPNKIENLNTIIYKLTT